MRVTKKVWSQWCRHDHPPQKIEALATLLRQQAKLEKNVTDKGLHCISTHSKWLSVNALTGKAAFVRTGNRS